MSANAASTPGTGGAPTGGIGYGEIFDRGYQHYTGPRLGRRQAFRSLVGYSIKRAMGIRKSWTAKVLPILLYTTITIPLIVMIGISAIAPQVQFASYTNYFGAIFAAQGIFVATIAPEMVCPDRREKTLPLYFARAITRGDYVLAKIVATIVLTMTMSLVPAVILWFGRQLIADSPWRAMRDNLGDLGRVVLLGSLIAIFLGTTGLMVSSLTDRKGVAVTVIVMGFLLMTGAAHSAFQVVDSDWRRYLIFLSISDVFQAISGHLFGDVDVEIVNVADFPLWAYLVYVAAVVAVCILIIRWRYRPQD
ncbi:MAG: ABC transporter permease [Thermomicrobiales bacterium]